MHTNATFLKEQCMHKYFPSIVVSSLMSMIPKSIDWRITNTQKRELQLLSPSHIIRSFQKTWNTACKFCKRLLWQQLYGSFFVLDNWLPSAFHHVKKVAWTFCWISPAVTQVILFEVLQQTKTKSFNFQGSEVTEVLGCSGEKKCRHKINAESVTFAQSQCGLLC